MNRYLVDARGRQVGSRAQATLLLLAAVLGPLLVLVVGIAVAAAGAGGVGVVVALAGAGAYPLALGLVFAGIFRSARGLDVGYQQLLAGNAGAALPAAHRTLAGVFRADARCKAFYLLGLCAEAAGDFAESADLFARADAAMPLAAVQRRRTRVAALAAAHAAIALTALGRLPEAQVSLVRAQRNLMTLMGPDGAFAFFFDDGGWGLGALSVNSVIDSIEPRRDPRGLLALAGAFLAYRHGAFRQVVDVLGAEQAALAHHLFPRERALATVLAAGAHRALAQGGAHRGAAALPTEAGDDPWVARALAAVPALPGR